MRVLSIKIDEDLKKLIEKEAIRKNMTKSEIIRRCLANCIYEDKPFETKRIKVAIGFTGRKIVSITKGSDIKKPNI